MTDLAPILARVVSQLDELERLAAPERAAARVEAISGWSIGEHLSHLLLAGELTLAGIGRLEQGEPPAELGGRPSFLGRCVLLTGWIPRGRGKAPPRTLPGKVSIGELGARFAALRAGYASLEPRLAALAGCRHTIPHPVFRNFGPGHWLRFADVHQRHHLRIIAEIERAVGSSTG